MAGRDETPREISIDGLAAEGDGVGRLDGRAVFVPGTVPGDRARVRLLKQKDRWARGELLEVLAGGPERVEPPCPVAADCGGCQWQQVSAAGQKAARLEVLASALGRLAGLPDWPEPVFVAADAPFGYRRRVELHGAKVPGEPLRLGFYARGSHRVVPHERCPLLAEPLAAVLAELAAVLDAALSRPTLLWLEATLLEGPALQLLLRVEDTAAAPVLAALDAWRCESMKAVHASVRALEGPRLFREAQGPHLLERVRIEAPGGKALDYALYTRPGEFVQANAAMNRRLVAALLEATRPQEGPWLLDLYCGSGNFSLPLALAGARVLGVEGRRSALRSARKAAREAGAARARFRPGSAEEVLPALVAEGRHYSRVVVDPPRQGAPELAAQLDALGIEEIHAVSCHPGSLARDLKAWIGRGFTLEALTLFDFFPQTRHCEVLARLVRSGSSG